MGEYIWSYTVWNGNAYLLLFIIFILICIILIFNLYKKKTDKFYNIPVSNTTSNTSNTVSNTTSNTTSNTSSNTTSNTVSNTDNNILFSNIDTLDGNDENTYTIYIKDQDKQKTQFELDSTQNDILQNDILQGNSNLFTQDNTNIIGQEYNKLNNEKYASIDSIGNSMTDMLGGINSNLGYTILEEIPTSIKALKNVNSNPNTYDNTQSYYTGLNTDALDGVEGKGSGSGSGSGSKYKYKLVGKDDTPIIMQKDFAGVANIFAPNIYISNPPLNSDGYPDISYSV